MLYICKKIIKFKQNKKIKSTIDISKVLNTSIALFTTYIASKALEEYQTNNIMEKVKLENEKNKLETQINIHNQNCEYYNKNIPYILKFFVSLPPSIK